MNITTKTIPNATRVEKSSTDTHIAQEGSESILYVAEKQHTNAYRKTLRFSRAIIRAAKDKKQKRISIPWALIASGKPETLSDEDFARHIASHLVVAGYDFTKYKTGEKAQNIEQVSITGAPSTIQKHLEAGTLVGEAMNSTRDLCNTSAGDLTPAHLASAAQSRFKGVAKTTVTIFDEKKLATMKAGAILGVGQGSTHKPRLIVVSYTGGAKNEKPIALVGKGITFDSGGLQVKPSNGGMMHEMHMDMTGGAVVLGAIEAIARLKLPVNVVAVVPAAENMISSTSYRPGDVLTSLSGKTIEVLNTDAEGRLVLADGLTYVQRTYKPRCIVDVATLTGAALVAMGMDASAFFATSDELADLVMKTSEVTGEYHWRLPMWEEYQYMVKSDRADIANIPSDGSRWGGTINGAMFLAEFVEKDTPWIHIDMAPRMEGTSRDFLGKGSSGEPLRMLVEFVRYYGEHGTK
jgi:leucyl aminopeptidase